MAKYIKCLSRLIAAGYDKDKALYCVFYAFGLTAKQLAVLERSIK